MFAAGDFEGAANAVQELMDEEIHSRVVAEGKRLVQSKYSLEASIQRWYDVIQQLSEINSKPYVKDLKTATAGRLDLLFGSAVGERLRSILGRTFTHQSAGSEWPHAFSTTPSDEDFLEWASTLDDKVHACGGTGFSVLS
jgi:hypothetical protein